MTTRETAEKQQGGREEKAEELWEDKNEVEEEEKVEEGEDLAQEKSSIGIRLWQKGFPIRNPRGSGSLQTSQLILTLKPPAGHCSGLF